jgi:hypothetical protein
MAVKGNFALASMAPLKRNGCSHAMPDSAEFRLDVSLVKRENCSDLNAD